MARPPSIQWYYKQYLGDNKVLAMDWDARGMHVHLLNLSIQEDPPGSLPDDDAAIRRWLSLPLGSVDADQTWRRVKPQILAAWRLEGSRWFNDGMVRSCDRVKTYSKRYKDGTKLVRNKDEIPVKSYEDEEQNCVLDSKEEKPQPFNAQEISLFVMQQTNLSGAHIQQTIEQQLLACKHMDLRPSAERMIAAIERYKTNGGDKIYLWLSEGGWLREECDGKRQTKSAALERPGAIKTNIIDGITADAGDRTERDRAERESGPRKRIGAGV